MDIMWDCWRRMNLISYLSQNHEYNSDKKKITNAVV